MAKSKVLSVSVPEDMLPVVQMIAEKEGLSKWFQEKVRQYGADVDLDAVNATLKEVSEKLSFVTQCVDKLKSERCPEMSGQEERVDVISEEIF